MADTHSDAGEEFFAVTSKPAARALVAAGYRTLEDLSSASERELLALHGMGPKGIRQLNAALAERGQAIGSALAE
ncbi:MAG: helix-hairpin-helix domain-containing protein [Thermomicrobiales bacterium]